MFFNIDPNDPNLPQGLRDFIKSQQAHEAAHKETSKVSKRAEEQVETEILMELWRICGDGSQSYWDAFRTISLFTRSRDMIFTDILEDSISVQSKIAVLKSLARLLDIQANALIEAGNIREKVLKDNGLPIED